MMTKCVFKRHLGYMCLVSLLLHIAVIIPLHAEPLHCQKDGVLNSQDGDVTFALMLPPADFGAGNDPECRISAQALQHFLMVEILVEKLNAVQNNTGFVPGVKIGFTSYTSCGEPLVSARNVITYLNSTLAHLPSTCPKERTTSHNIGIIGPSSSSTSQVVASLTRNLNIPVISPFASLAALSDKSSNPSLLRTVPSDVQQMTLIVDLLKELRWTYIAVAYQDDEYGRSGKRLLTERAKKRGICVSEEDLPLCTDYGHGTTRFVNIVEGAKDKSMAVVVIAGSKATENLMHLLKIPESPSYQKGLHFVLVDAVNTDVTVFKDGKKGQGTLAVSLGSGGLDTEELKRELNQRFQTQAGDPSAHPLVAEYVEDFKTSNPNDPLPDKLVAREVDAFLPATVHAVLALVQGLRRQHHDSCQQRPGMCNDLIRAINDGELLSRVRSDSVDYEDFPKDVLPRTLDSRPFTFSFDDNGDFQVSKNESLYTLHSYDEDSSAYHRIGNYSNKQLHLEVGRMNWGEGQELPTSMCVGDCCDKCRDNGAIPITFLEGDVYIVGIFSLHQPDPEDPFKCGPYRTVAYDAIALEGFLFSIRKLREITGIRFGAVVFDSCYSPARILSTLTSYFSTVTTSYTQMFSTVVSSENVLGVVGCLSSDCTVVVTPFFASLNRPVLSYASSSPDLDDKINYPYFLRMVPSDNYQARVMVEIIRKMGWEYVGLLYVNNNYGAKGIKAIRRIVDAPGSGICAAEEIAISSKETMSNSDLFDARRTLREQKVKVVVFFGITTRFTDFVKNLKDYPSKSDQRLIILASEAWSDNENIVRAGQDGAHNAVRGALSLKLKDIDIEYKNEFKSHLSNLDLQSGDTSTWFAEFWQKRFQCRIRGGFHDSGIGDSLQAERECELDRKLGEQSKETIRAGIDNQRTRHTVRAVMAMGKGLEAVKNRYCNGGLASCDYLQSSPRDVVEAIKTQKDGVKDAAIFDEDGNGAIGFDVYNIQWNGSADVYVKVGTFEPGTTQGCGLEKDKIKFYGGDGLEVSSPQATCSESWCSNCSHRQAAATLPPETIDVDNTTSDDSMAEYRQADILLISLVVVSIVVVVLALVLCYCRKTQVCGKKRNRYNTAFDELTKQVYPGRTFPGQVYTSHTRPREGNLPFSTPDISPYKLNGETIVQGVTNPAFLPGVNQIESVSQVVLTRGLSVEVPNGTSVAGNLSRQSSVVPQTAANYRNGRQDQCQSPLHMNTVNLKRSPNELHNSSDQRAAPVVYTQINKTALQQQHGSSTPEPQTAPDQPQSTDNGNIVIARGQNGQLLAYMVPAHHRLQQATAAHPQVMPNVINHDHNNNHDHSPYSRAAELQDAHKAAPVTNSEVVSNIPTQRPADSTRVQQSPRSQAVARFVSTNLLQTVAEEMLPFTNIDQQSQHMLPLSQGIYDVNNQIPPQPVHIMTDQPGSGSLTPVQSHLVQYALVPTDQIPASNSISATHPPAEINTIQ